MQLITMCERFAKRGYAVANVEYRLGWNGGAGGSLSANFYKLGPKQYTERYKTLKLQLDISIETLKTVVILSELILIK